MYLVRPGNNYNSTVTTRTETGVLDILQKQKENVYLLIMAGFFGMMPFYLAFLEGFSSVWSLCPFVSLLSDITGFS